MSEHISSKKCAKCKNSSALGFDISMAFQPIVNLNNNSYFAYEALVRGTASEGAYEVFKQVNNDNLYLFDQSCRQKAIEHAAKLNLSTLLSINFMPNAVYEPERCIQTTLNTAKKYQFPLESIIFEFTENEQVTDKKHLANIICKYTELSFQTAIDDFGAGYSGLNILCDINVDIVKIDRQLIVDIDKDKRRQHIISSIFDLLSPIVKHIIVEGIETAEECKTLHSIGFRYFQGYYFARPEFESLPLVDFKRIDDALAVTG